MVGNFHKMVRKHHMSVSINMSYVFAISCPDCVVSGTIFEVYTIHHVYSIVLHDFNGGRKSLWSYTPCYKITHSYHEHHMNVFITARCHTTHDIHIHIARKPYTQ